MEDRTRVSEWKLSLSLHSAHRERVSREAPGYNRPIVDVGSQLSVVQLIHLTSSKASLLYNTVKHASLH